jgi:hypothetical protein
VKSIWVNRTNPSWSGGTHRPHRTAALAVLADGHVVEARCAALGR